MRAFIHFLIGAVLFVLLLAVAMFLATSAFSTEHWNLLLDLMRARRLDVIYGAGAVVLLIALFMLTGVRKRKDESVITFQNEGGSVSISVRALQESLARLISEFAAVLDLRPKVCGTSDSLQVELDVKVRSGAQIPELCRLLQNRVKESIQGELGLMEVKAVKVNIREIVATPPEKTRSQAPDEAVEWEASIRP